MVEFALVFPIFLLVLFGLIDVGRYVYATSAYGQAAREGARQASVEQWTYTCPASVSIKTRENCTEALTLSIIPAGAPTPNLIAYTCPPTCRAGDLMTVTVEGPFQFATPVISTLLGNPLISQTTKVVIQ